MAQRKPQVEAAELDEDRDVRLIVRTLMAAHEADAASLAVVLGIGRSAVYEKLNGKRRFSISDIRRMARYFAVDPGVFFAEPRSLVGRRATLTGDTVGYHVRAGQGAPIAARSAA